MKCKRCGKESDYPICSNCVSGEEKRMLDELYHLDQTINDHKQTIKGIRKAKMAMPPMRVAGFIVCFAGIVMAFIPIIWLEIFGICFLMTGLILLLLSWPQMLTVNLLYDGEVSDYHNMISGLKKQKKELVQKLRRINV